MKRILAIGRVRNGGAVEITAPTLEERLDAQIARNAQVIERNRARLAEIDAMHADLDELLAGKPPAYKLTAAMLEEIENDETAAFMRCLVYYVLIPALITMLLLGIAGGAIIANELGG